MTARRGLLVGARVLNGSYSSIASLSDLEQGLTTSSSIWHFGRYLLARHLARSVSHGLLVQPLGLILLLAPCRPDFLAIGGGGSVLGLEEGFEEVYRDGQDDGGVLVDRDLPHRLEEPQLQCCGALQTICCLPEALRCLKLTLRCYDLRPPLALRLGLAGHRPLHVLRDLDIFDLDDAHLHPPGVGLLIYDALEFVVYLLPIGQEVIEILLSEHAAQGGLGDLAGGKHVVLDLYYALVGVCDPEVDNGVDAGGDVVAGYDILGRDVHGDGPKVYLDHPVHERPQEEQSRSLGSPLYPAESEDNTPLVLLDHLDGAEYDRDDEYREEHHHDSPDSYPHRLQ